MALVDDADDAMGAQRLAVGAGEPAAGVLDPDSFVGPRRRPQRIFAPDRERRRPRRGSPSASPRRSASVRSSGSTSWAKPRPVAIVAGSAIPSTAPALATPAQHVGIDPPFVGDLADRARRSRRHRGRRRCLRGAASLGSPTGSSAGRSNRRQLRQVGFRLATIAPLAGAPCTTAASWRQSATNLREQLKKFGKPAALHHFANVAV